MHGNPPCSEPRKFIFFPNRREERAYIRKERPKVDSWKAPEHAKLTSDMKRDWPKDDLGRRIPGREKELVLDKRPTIMRPEKDLTFI